MFSLHARMWLLLGALFAIVYAIIVMVGAGLIGALSSDEQPHA